MAGINTFRAKAGVASGARVAWRYRVARHGGMCLNGTAVCERGDVPGLSPLLRTQLRVISRGYASKVRPGEQRLAQDIEAQQVACAGEETAGLMLRRLAAFLRPRAILSRYKQALAGRPWIY